LSFAEILDNRKPESRRCLRDPIVRSALSVEHRFVIDTQTHDYIARHAAWRHAAMNDKSALSNCDNDNDIEWP